MRMTHLRYKKTENQQGQSLIKRKTGMVWGKHLDIEDSRTWLKKCRKGKCMIRIHSSLKCLKLCWRSTKIIGTKISREELLKDSIPNKTAEIIHS